MGRYKAKVIETKRNCATLLLKIENYIFFKNNTL